MTYKIGEKEYVSWSSKNQHILDKLVEREVFCCMTSEMEYMISRVPFCDQDNPFDEDIYSDIFIPYCPECETTYGFKELTVGELLDGDFKEDNHFNTETHEFEQGFECPVCGIFHKTIEAARECCGKDTVVYKCLECGKILNEDDYDSRDIRPEEVYEWWAVSNWFGEKLREQGCVVIDAWGKSYWGRTTTGQSISLDGCIVNIAKDMQILEGMEHSWE